MPTNDVTTNDVASNLLNNLGSPNGFIASFIWGTIGMGFAAYGWKQKSMRPLYGGIALMAGSYFFADSALIMSLFSVVAIAAIFWLKRYFP